MKERTRTDADEIRDLSTRLRHTLDVAHNNLHTNVDCTSVHYEMLALDLLDAHRSAEQITAMLKAKGL